MPVVSTFKKGKYAERNAQIRKMAMEGKKSEEIAEITGLKVTNIRYICKGLLRDGKRYIPPNRNPLEKLDDKSVKYFSKRFKEKP